MIKIFCIGLPKTGTTSLGRAHEILGFSKAPYDLTIINSVAHWISSNKSGPLPKNVRDHIEKYDVFEDWPYPIIWKELCDYFPNSKFILSQRINEETWLRSLQKHTNRNQSKKSRDLRNIFFKKDCPFENENHYLNYYTNHNKKILAKFNNNTNFCQLTVGDDMNWSRLCEFHNLPIPNEEFPFLNNSIEKKGWLYNLKKSIKKIFR